MIVKREEQEERAREREREWVKNALVNFLFFYQINWQLKKYSHRNINEVFVQVNLSSLPCSWSTIILSFFYGLFSNRETIRTCKHYPRLRLIAYSSLYRNEKTKKRKKKNHWRWCDTTRIVYMQFRHRIIFVFSFLSLSLCFCLSLSYQRSTRRWHAQSTILFE